ncbi:MAG: fluoride efflux transporter CrcB [Flavobacteriales bacterium]
MKWLLVFLGGGLGSAARFGIGLWVNPVIKSFPLATFIANALAAIIIGALFAIRKGDTHSPVWWLIAAGFCGGLSTFSTFNLETAQLMRDGQIALAVLNIVLSVLICTAITWWVAFHLRA